MTTLPRPLPILVLQYRVFRILSAFGSDLYWNYSR